MRRYRVGILGATGLVGQRLLERLEGHPWFETAALGASERSAGRPYGEAVRWALDGEPPPDPAGLPVHACEPRAFEGCDLVLSGLDAESGRRIEPRFVEAGHAVVSNCSAHRSLPDVPVVVPEVNASHLDLIEAQRRRTGRGFLVTNPNCSVTGLVLALAPLHRAFVARRAVVVTLQALSGAGLEGPRGLEIVDNVIPFIPGEEEKIEAETGKILGTVAGGAVRGARLEISAHCHRVGTIDGHLAALSVELESGPSPAEAAEALRAFRGESEGLGLPSAPERPVVVIEGPDRPQPRRDRLAGGGMSVVVGRIRPCPVLGLRLELLAHNAVRGAAGGTLLNAELLVARGLVGGGRGA